MATTADGHAERDAALLMLQTHAHPGRPHRTLGADKHFDTRDFVDVTRQLGYTPHVSQNVKRTRGQCHRSPHHASCGLRDQSGLSASHRTRLRVAQATGGASQGEAPRPRQGRQSLRVRLRGLQPAATAQADRDGRDPRLTRPSTVRPRAAAGGAPACTRLDRSRPPQSQRRDQPSWPVLQQALRRRLCEPPRRSGRTISERQECPKTHAVRVIKGRCDARFDSWTEERQHAKSDDRCTYRK